MSQFHSFIEPDAKPIRLNSTTLFAFTEGPVWDNGSSLYFSDGPSNTTRVLKQSGIFEVFRSNTKGGNGMALTHGGDLLVCEGHGKKISLVNITAKSLTTVAEKYNNLLLNGPNDLVLDKAGGIYFTDPVFSHAGQTLTQETESIYYAPPQKPIQKVWTGAYKPNGIVLRPDGQSLLVDDSFSDIVWCIELSSPGVARRSFEWGKLEIPDKAYVYDINGSRVDFPEFPAATLADGMALDIEGNLYVTTQQGIQVLDLRGNLIGILEFPEQPANCAFGGHDMSTLFVTAQTSVYSLKLNSKGLKLPIS